MNYPQIRVYWTRAGEPSGTGTLIGTAIRNASGWRFYPELEGKNVSRRNWPTWEECLPKWTGGLDRTTSTAVYGD